MKQSAALFLLAASAFAGGAVVTLLTPSLDRVPAAHAQAPATLPGGSAELLRLGERFEAVARKVSPTVVAVEASKRTAGKSKPVEESGSGVLFQPEGQRFACVLTNNHVIDGAVATQITVSLWDGKLLRTTQVWADPESDIAVLRVEGENLPTATLGDSDAVRVGQWVLAVGSPFGLNQTVTHGIISARERGQVSLGSTIRIKDFLQTDAAINPGSSGGPLLNLDGEVIGINTAIASHSGSNSGVAFSIPINMAKRVVRQLLEKGAVSRGYLGMQLAPSFEAADALKLGLDKVQGALVESVYPNTPAALAGMQARDVILQLDGALVRNETHFITQITSLPPGQKVKVLVWRDRQTVTLEAVIGDWSRDQSRFRSAR